MIRILVIDDNYSYLKLLRTFFATTEIDAHIATNAEDALDAVKKRSFDLLITDMKMPGIDGIELARWVKERDKEMPILMMTSYPTPDAAARAAETGISEIFDKCIPLPEMAKNVRKHARNRHASDNVFSRSPKTAVHFSAPLMRQFSTSAGRQDK